MCIRDSRWTLRIASLVGLFLLLLVIGLTLVTRHFVYNGVRQQLMGQAQSFVEMEKISGGDFYTLTKAYVEQLPEGDVFAVAVDDDGEPFAVSQGTAADYAGGEDFQKAAAGAGVGEWMGTLPNGQMVMAMTALVQTDSGQRLGGIRLFHPMGGATATVLWICAAMIGSGLLLLAAVLLVSRRFVNGMMAPLKEITFTANKIAQGDFNIRLEKQKEDEIGELCDAINHMAISLDTTENMKNEFVSSVSHELRTPLTAIKGCLLYTSWDGRKWVARCISLPLPIGMMSSMKSWGFATILCSIPLPNGSGTKKRYRTPASTFPVACVSIRNTPKPSRKSTTLVRQTLVWALPWRISNRNYWTALRGCTSTPCVSKTHSLWQKHWTM